MQAERALERLGQHQRDISSILAQARRPLAWSEASAMKALALLRWELIRALREYQLFKHTEIFDPVIQSSSKSRAAAAGVLKRRCLEIGDAFARHVQRWSLQGPSSDWDAYQNEAAAMIQQIERHLDAELSEVRLLLAGVSRTRAS